MNPTTHHPLSSIESALRADHAQLELLFERVIASVRGKDPEQIRARWIELDRALERHLSAEEELILPRFSRDHPHEAERVCAEHRNIRAALVKLGVDLDLHSLCPDSARHFIDALRRHAAFEEAAFYPWTQAHLAEPERLSLLDRLRVALHRSSASASHDETSRQELS